MRGRTYSREFKLAIVRQLASGEKRKCVRNTTWHQACWRQDYAATAEARAAF